MGRPVKYGLVQGLGLELSFLDARFLEALEVMASCFDGPFRLLLVEEDEALLKLVSFLTHVVKGRRRPTRCCWSRKGMVRLLFI